MTFKNTGKNFGYISIPVDLKHVQVVGTDALIEANVGCAIMKEMLLSELEVHVLHKGEHWGILGTAKEFLVKPTPYHMALRVDSSVASQAAWNILTEAYGDASFGSFSTHFVAEHINTCEAFEIKVFVHADDPSVVAYIGVCIS